MNEPVTLWDWGMARAEQEAKEAGRVADELGVGLIWVSYNWDNNEIDFNLHILDVLSPITHELCNRTRRAFIADIAGASDWHLEREGDLVRSILHTTIHQWFSHEGFVRLERDENLAEELTRIMFVGVRLRGSASSIECRARIMEFDAPSKPIS